MIVRAATLLAAVAVLLGCILASPAGSWLLTAGAALLPVSLMAHAVRRHGATRGARYVLLALAILLGGTLTVLLRGHIAGATGLPLLLLGLWFLPLLLTGLGYAVTFVPRAGRRGTEPEGSGEHTP